MGSGLKQKEGSETSPSPSLPLHDQLRSGERRNILFLQHSSDDETYSEASLFSPPLSWDTPMVCAPSSLFRKEDL